MSNLEKVALSNQLHWPVKVGAIIVVLWEADNMEKCQNLHYLEFCAFITGIILQFLSQTRPKTMQGIVKESNREHFYHKDYLVMVCLWKSLLFLSLFLRTMKSPQLSNCI